MNQNEHISDQLNSVNKKPVTLNIPDFMEDFNIDETSFKPVTRGLGFHQEVKQKQFSPAKIVANHTNSDIVAAKSVGKLVATTLDQKNAVNSMRAENMPSKGALAAFYGTSNLTQEIRPDGIEENSKKTLQKHEAIKRVEASSYAQFIAYIIDLALVFSFTIVTIAALVLVSRIDYNILLKVISFQDQIVFGSSLFIIYYLLYFTVLDMNASPGKSVMGIRLFTVSGKNVSTKHTFMRASITLLSVAALTLPTLLDFQGRLSGTKVFKDK